MRKSAQFPCDRQGDVIGLGGIGYSGLYGNELADELAEREFDDSLNDSLPISNPLTGILAEANLLVPQQVSTSIE